MKKEQVIQLWLDAEEENRKHTQAGEDKCLELKTQFQDNLKELSSEDQQYVRDYIDDIAG